jgi:hypothetical protein
MGTDNRKSVGSSGVDSVDFSRYVQVLMNFLIDWGENDHLSITFSVANLENFEIAAFELHICKTRIVVVISQPYSLYGLLQG